MLAYRWANIKPTLGQRLVLLQIMQYFYTNIINLLKQNYHIYRI